MKRVLFLDIDGLTPDLTTEEIIRSKKFSLVKAEEILFWLKTNNDVLGWWFSMI